MPLSGCRVSSGVTLKATSGTLAGECRKESDEMYEPSPPRVSSDGDLSSKESEQGKPTAKFAARPVCMLM
jgi:hypothetical protein